MVIRDLSHINESNETQRSYKDLTAFDVPLGPVADRFIALILDFLIFSPVVSFGVASLVKDLKTVLILNSDSENATVIWLSFLFAIVALSSFLQSLFLYFWGATPGQKFMQLKVVSYPQWMNEEERLTYAQCLLRSVGWWVCVFVGAIPFLDIAGHPLRRAVHERMSDTIVLTKKREAVDRPLALETRYISSALWVFYGFLFVIGLTFMAKTYKAALLEGLIGEGAGSASQASCSEIPTEKYKGQKRLDIAVALYLAEEVDNSCVYTEAQQAIWTSSGEDKALAQLAMALVSEDEADVTKYHEKTCETDPLSEACSISKILREQAAPALTTVESPEELKLISSRVLYLGKQLSGKNYRSAMRAVRSLMDEPPLHAFLEKNRVQIAWVLNDKAMNKNTRSPASEDEKKILEEFKMRYHLK